MAIPSRKNPISTRISILCKPEINGMREQLQKVNIEIQPHYPIRETKKRLSASHGVPLPGYIISHSPTQKSNSHIQ